MIEQTARVVSTQSGHAWVVPEGASSCGSCQSKSGCSSVSTGLFSFLRPQSDRLYVANPLYAKPGDEVVIGMPGNVFLVYSLLAYLLPLLSMIVFAVFGSELFAWMGMEQESGAVLAGVAGLFGGFKVAGWAASRVGRDEEVYPVILRHKEQVIYPANTIPHL